MLHNKENKKSVGWSKYIRIYIGYIIPLFISYLLIIFINNNILKYNANFVSKEPLIFENNSVDLLNVRCNYFLDCSLSMLGFFNEEINSDMHSIADIFQQINVRFGRDNFFRCALEITSVDSASEFYEYMQSQQPLIEYYDNRIQNLDGNSFEDQEGGEGTIADALPPCDLSDIFSANYISGSMSNDVNILITDMNFLQNINDISGHNERLERLTFALTKNIHNANISIYAIESYFAGAVADEFDPTSTEADVTTRTFFVIIFSENERAYEVYCEEFESQLTNKSIINYEKFELVDQLFDTNPQLSIDWLAINNDESLTQKSNLNFANNLFENLDPNELAVQISTLEDNACILQMPVAHLTLPGYYQAKVEGPDDTELLMEVDLWRPESNTWRQIQDLSMINPQEPELYYKNGEWYLRTKISFNKAIDVGKADSWLQLNLEKCGHKYLALNLRFYMECPAYSLPEWMREIAYSPMDNQNIRGIQYLAEEIIEVKESAYKTQDKNSRYMGNIVLYVLYE